MNTLKLTYSVNVLSRVRDHSRTLNREIECKELLTKDKLVKYRQPALLTLVQNHKNGRAC